MADSDDAALADLKRDTRKRSVKILAIMGTVLALAGIGVAALGFTFEEPAERIATRSVPHGAEYGLIILGAIVALAGIGFVVQAVRLAKQTA